MTYCTSDLHGCDLSELLSLLQRVNFSDKDFLFILGDVVDRGCHSSELLKWLLMQTNVELILGNHEAMLLSCRFVFEEITDERINYLDSEKMTLLSRWLRNGAEPTMASLKELLHKEPDVLENIFDYLMDAPLYEEITVGGRKFLLSHTLPESFDPTVSYDSYGMNDWIWNREGLFDRENPGITAVFGHTPTEYISSSYKGKIYKSQTRIDIDTGDSLSLLRLDDLSEFYLQ